MIFKKRSAATRAREEYAVRKPITKQIQEVEVWDDPLAAEIHLGIRESIEKILERELQRALGAIRYGRSSERAGYRNGSITRELGTPMGQVELDVPRGRLVGPSGAESEWHSTKLPRHARRMRSIDKAVMSIYLSGTNQRRVAAALKPLLKGLPLSKSSVSRLAARLMEQREAWMSRDLGEEKIAYLFLDGFGVTVRRDGRVVRNPVLIAVGVRETGEKVLLSLQLSGGESTAAWQSLVEDLHRRGLKAPVLSVIDGSPGLRAAVEAMWPATEVQRCAVHKLRNLLAHAPQHAHEAIKEDFHKIMYAQTAAAAALAYQRFLDRWKKRCPAVAASLEEAGSELLTFTRFPKEQWKSLRTTNIIERLNGELRRRIKTQGPWSSEEGVLNLLFGLFAGGMVRLRKIDGWRTITAEDREAA